MDNEQWILYLKLRSSLHLRLFLSYISFEVHFILSVCVCCVVGSKFTTNYTTHLSLQHKLLKEIIIELLDLYESTV